MHGSDTMDKSKSSKIKARRFAQVAFRAPVAILGVALALFLPTYAIGALLHTVFCQNRPGHPLLLYHYAIGFVVGILMMMPAIRELLAWARGR